MCSYIFLHLKSFSDVFLKIQYIFLQLVYTTSLSPSPAFCLLPLPPPPLSLFISLPLPFWTQYHCRVLFILPHSTTDYYYHHHHHPYVIFQFLTRTFFKRKKKDFKYQHFHLIYMDFWEKTLRIKWVSGCLWRATIFSPLRLYFLISVGQVSIADSDTVKICQYQHYYALSTRSHPRLFSLFSFCKGLKHFEQSLKRCSFIICFMYFLVLHTHTHTHTMSMCTPSFWYFFLHKLTSFLKFISSFWLDMRLLLEYIIVDVINCCRIFKMFFFVWKIRRS